LGRYRVKTADGLPCGRIKDVYFDDCAWKVTHLVLSIEPSGTRRNEVLLQPSDVVEVSEEIAIIGLKVSAGELEELPLASSVRPVCGQYAAFAYASRGAGTVADPHLRSAKTVMHYRLNVSGEAGGNLADFLYEGEGWEIRFLGIEQKFEQKTMRFYVLPQAVERITWAAQKVVLRELKPVALTTTKEREVFLGEAAA
jgi:hypothetical protein